MCDYHSQMSKELPPSRVADQFQVRFPEGMRDRIAEAAQANNRSMNAQIVHMIAEHFQRVDDQVDELRAGLATVERVGISIGLTDPVDRAAVLRAMLLEERMLLRRRINDLGGRDAVLKMSDSELAKSIRGPRLRGTPDEQKTYLSRVIESMPLTAILTSEELDHIAQRLALIQQSSNK